MTKYDQKAEETLNIIGEGKKCKILVTEDKNRLLNIYTKQLNKLGANTIGYEEPYSSINILEKDNFDITISDYLLGDDATNMPTGIDIVEAAFRKGVKYNTVYSGILSEDDGTTFEKLRKLQGMYVSKNECKTLTEVINQTVLKKLITEDNPFKITYKLFNLLRISQVDDLYDRLFDQCDDFAFSQFNKNSKLEWVVILGEHNNIVDKSEDPSKKPVWENYAEDHGLIPLIYNRPRIVENTNWSKIGSNDYYPGLNIQFPKGLKLNAEKCHLDTGAEHSFISIEELLNKKIVNDNEIRKSQRAEALGWKYKYLPRDFKVILLGDSKKEHIQAKIKDCHCVRDWLRHPLSAYNRKSLIGRDILINNPHLKFILDGQNKNTQIIQNNNS